VHPRPSRLPRPAVLSGCSEQRGRATLGVPQEAPAIGKSALHWTLRPISLIFLAHPLTDGTTEA
jgi:hypothetical protein